MRVSKLCASYGTIALNLVYSLLCSAIIPLSCTSRVDPSQTREGEIVPKMATFATFDIKVRFNYKWKTERGAFAKKHC